MVNATTCVKRGKSWRLGARSFPFFFCFVFPFLFRFLYSFSLISLNQTDLSYWQALRQFYLLNQPIRCRQGPSSGYGAGHTTPTKASWTALTMPVHGHGLHAHWAVAFETHFWNVINIQNYPEQQNTCTKLFFNIKMCIFTRAFWQKFLTTQLSNFVTKWPWIHLFP